jgi:hypothetical protein
MMMMWYATLHTRDSCRVQCARCGDRIGTIEDRPIGRYPAVLAIDIPDRGATRALDSADRAAQYPMGKVLYFPASWSHDASTGRWHMSRRASDRVKRGAQPRARRPPLPEPGTTTAAAPLVERRRSPDAYPAEVECPKCELRQWIDAARLGGLVVEGPTATEPALVSRNSLATMSRRPRRTPSPTPRDPQHFIRELRRCLKVEVRLTSTRIEHPDNDPSDTAQRRGDWERRARRLAWRQFGPLLRDELARNGQLMSIESAADAAVTVALRITQPDLEKRIWRELVEHGIRPDRPGRQTVAAALSARIAGSPAADDADLRDLAPRLARVIVALAASDLVSQRPLRAL